MTDMDEEALARALRNLPVEGSAPIDRIRSRGRTIRGRRRLYGVGITLAAVVAVGLPSLAAFGDDGANPTALSTAPSAEGSSVSPSGSLPTAPTGCPETYEERYDSAEPFLTTAMTEISSPELVPANLRLLWSDTTAAAPAQARAADRSRLDAEVAAFYASCPPAEDQSVLLVDLQDDVVSRTVNVWRTGTRHVVDSTVARTLDVEGTEVRINDVGPPESTITAEWDKYGATWSVRANPLTDEQLKELVKALQVINGHIDVSSWSLADEADHIIQGTGHNEPGAQSYNVEGALSLSVDEDDATLWTHAVRGSRLVNIGGSPALLNNRPASSGWSVSWQPSERLIANLSGEVDADELLRIAKTVAPAAPNDPRLIQAWSTSNTG